MFERQPSEIARGLQLASYCYDPGMLLAAVIVGLIAAYYLGFRAGGIAAGATAVLLIAAELFPPAKLIAYGAVAVGLVLLFALGPNYQTSDTRQRFMAQGRRLLGALWRFRK